MELYDPEGRIGDVWPTALAIPGFIGGVVFSALLRFAEGRRSIDEVSLTIPANVGDVSPGAAGMIGIAIVLSAVAAIGSTICFRLIARRQTPAVAGRQ